jgi:hypothetical protein
LTIPINLNKNPARPFENFSSPYPILATKPVKNKKTKQEIGTIQIHSDGSSYFKIPDGEGFKFMKLRIRTCTVEDQFYYSLSPTVKYLRDISDQMFIKVLGEVGKAKLFNESQADNIREKTLIA